MLNTSVIDSSTPAALAGNWAARLQRFARKPVERCELCALTLGEQHPHLFDLKRRQAVCACIGCATVLGPRVEGRYRAIPIGATLLPDFRMTEVEWTALQIPIGMAFVIHSGAERRPVAYYPSPAGPTEALVDRGSWAAVVANNPVLAELESDVEALLVNRIKGRRIHVRAPIDRCFALVALFRHHWQGFTGGDRIWQEVDDFFDELSGPRRGRIGHG